MSRCGSLSTNPARDSHRVDKSRGRAQAVMQAEETRAERGRLTRGERMACRAPMKHAASTRWPNYEGRQRSAETTHGNGLRRTPVECNADQYCASETDRRRQLGQEPWKGHPGHHGGR